MRARLTLTIAAAALLGLAAPSARAQEGFGLRTGVSVDPDQFYVGAHVGVGPVLKNLWFRPNVEVGLGDDVTLVALNAELAYWFPSSGRWSLYLGGGPALNIYDHDGGSDSEGGLNLMLGVAHRGGFFVEGKVGIFDSPELKLGFGYSF